ncbi:MAG: UDP-2,4-diacetamido-2,4,6-trideoxy-beta-L-altropyranose hydrolase [Sutterellaceae bacterium]|nr:UDP-2,4-diacetamido-2,4,6-trideoxy-beta-L-altropyranose hydrolase [Burkholderiaceae bacterium]MDW8429041.1 UDP-2,4-diacetamido-2,4,6-trideoxy-beta-L-altropyranose hydrolase [Sutterellaceae bacterium]
MKTVAFRVDASERIGLGHVMRCLALADALKGRGARTVFVVAAMPEPMVAALHAKGHEVIWLKRLEAAGRGDPRAEFDLDAQRSDAVRTQRVLEPLAPLDWLVVDHYRLGVAWERAAAGVARRIAVIDDHAQRRHDCDLLVDQNVAAAWAQYDGLLPARALRLVGPRFALLRHEFARAQAPRVRQDVRTVLIAFGGADPTCETEKALRGVAAAGLPHLAADVVVRADNPKLKAIRALAGRIGSAQVHVDTARMHELIERADLAIGGAGVSALERCALGLPSLLIAVADNQRPVASALGDRGAAIYLGTAKEVNEATIARAISGLASMPHLLQRLSACAAETCDGCGARRVASRMLALEVRLRPAVAADRDRVLEWRNHQMVRRFSLNTRPIDPDRHAEWFAQRLNDPAGALLIAEDARGPVGVLRYDVRGDVARVSVYVVPGRQGEGLGAVLLHAGHRWLAENRPTLRAVDADILVENAASRVAFAEAGYSPQQLTLRHKLST